jgi:hypothetical protein
MVGNRKKTRSSKKKKGQNKISQTHHARNSPNLNIHQILTQADEFLESSNLENALQLYTYAANVLRKQFETITTNEESDVLLLPKVLGKLAEVKVSMGDQEGGRQDFSDAINLMRGDGPTNDSVAAAQWKEARASLYLYLGQLSSSKDALTAFTRAVHDLKDCMRLLEEFKNAHSGDETIQSALDETR